MDIEELKARGRAAVERGDTEAADRILKLLQQAQQAQPSAPVKEPGFLQRLKDNWLPDDDETSMNTGEKVAQFINNTGEALTFGLIGDEADARVKSWLGQGDYEELLAKERAREDMFAEQHPYLDVAADLAGGVTGALAGGIAVGTGKLAAQGATRLSNMGRNALIGAGGGTTFGFMEGEGGVPERVREGLIGGAIGGIAGGALPEVIQLGAAAARKLGITKGTPVRAVQDALGVDAGVARQVLLALDEDGIKEGIEVAKTLGDDFMLADTPGLAPILDTAAQSSPRAGVVVSRALVERAKEAGKKTTAALDATLGKPVGLAARVKGIRQNSGPQLGKLYNRAYSAPIDYSSPGGMSLEAALQRVPQDVRAGARRLMDVEGLTSRQRKVSINPDGTFDITTMPDTRQIDYMTRAMGDAAEATRGVGALRGMNTEGRAIAGLQAEIRDLLKSQNPAYAKAVGTAKRDIRDIAALEAGEKALTAQVTRSEFAQVLGGMTKREKAQLAAGARDFIDDKMARIKPTMLQPDTDVKEAQELIKLLGSRDAIEKMQMLLPKAEAEKLSATLVRSATMLRLLAETAGNSKTAFRTALREAMKDATGPGPGGLLMQGRPAAAGQRLVQEATGNTPDALNRSMMKGFDALAQRLVEQGGKENMKALQVLKKVMAGKKITDNEFILLKMAVSSSGVSVSSTRGEEIVQGTMKALIR